MLPLLNFELKPALGAKLLLSAVCAIPAPAVAAPSSQPVPFPVLTNIAQVRALSAADAARSVPVKLSATVTAFNPSSIFIQDETGGTFINFPVVPIGTTVGDVLAVEGLSYVGRYLPGITSARISVLGRDSVPAAVPVTYDDLLTARNHYERVSIQGVVRSMARSTEPDRLTLMVAMGTRKLEVQIPALLLSNLPPCVDARVRIEGLAAGYINNRRQLLSPQLLVSRIEDLHIETPPRADPFAAPLTTAGALLNFTANGLSEHRVRVRGVVTHRQPDEAIFLRDGGHGLMVRTPQADPVQPGNLVEVVGFPTMGRFSAFLEDAEYRVIGNEPEPQPLHSTLVAALTGTNDANLITLDAEVLEVLETPAESVLVLRTEDAALRARMPRSKLSLRNGSNVRLAGVCRVEEFGSAGSGFGVSARSIELLLRSPRDVTVLSAPSGWTAQRLAITATILLGLALAAFVWIALLRRRVTEQAGVIREKIQREAALEERHRMAREMHDTLAQSFSGLGFQLEALNARLPPEAETTRKQLEVARQMVRHGQEGFRRSLMNLRAQELERGSLDEALADLARQITAGTGIELHCQMQRPIRGLPEAVEANLLRIGQECLANAVRHGQPNNIELEFRPEPHGVRMRIADDGAGFDPAQLKHAANGHFGWRGIRERAEQIGAQVDLSSQPGHGTTVIVTVPL